MLRRQRYRLLAAAVLGGHIALSGCYGAGKQAPGGVSPDFIALTGPASSARAQKQDTPKSLLEIGSDAPGSKEARGARVRATVNGEAILEEEIIAAAIQPLMSARSEAEKAQILNDKLTEIIERELLMQDAIARLSKKGGVRFLKELEKVADKEFERQWLYKLMSANKINDIQQFTRMLKDQGIPVELIRRQWVRNFIAMEYMRSKVEPQLNKIGHEQVVEFYDKNPNEFKVDDAVVWQDIFIANAKHPTPKAAKQFAESLIARVKKGEDFARLSKEFGDGECSLKVNSLGDGTKRGEIRPVEAEEIVFRLKEGEVGPPVAIETGFHIIRVTSRTYAGRKPFDEKTQRTINETLKNKAFQQEMRRIVNDLKRQAIIEVASEIK